jgi:hypothetical protein
MENWTAGQLHFNSQNGRYGLLTSDGWERDGFHCGEIMDVLIGGDWVPTRIEMNMAGEWYLVETGLKGWALENVPARVRTGVWYG